MSARTRIANLEKQVPVKDTRREFSEADNEAWERSMNALADALGVTRDEAVKALEAIRDDN
jgi:hypothetical protein